MINVDYNMGLKLDIVDRDIYLPKPVEYTGPKYRESYD